MADTEPFTPDAAGAGRRALRNGALAMIVAGNAIDGAERAHRQFAEADNMTEKLGALSALSTLPGPSREHALDAFARSYAAEPLILDKWFTLQAQIAETGTLDRVRALMNHHAFSLSNPNRVRALIGGFTANPTQFNRADGAGFDLLAEIVLNARSDQSADRRAPADRDALVALARAERGATRPRPRCGASRR